MHGIFRKKKLLGPAQSGGIKPGAAYPLRNQNFLHSHDYYGPSIRHLPVWTLNQL